MRIEIAYESPEARVCYEKLVPAHNPSNTGFDLCCVENVSFKPGQKKLISLGVTLRPPTGYYFDIVPRSSTWGKKDLLLGNSIGIIDQEYCGKDDVIKANFWNPTGKEVNLQAGDRVCQAVLRKLNEITEISEFLPKKKSRGGFGSTGK